MIFKIRWTRCVFFGVLWFVTTIPTHAQLNVRVTATQQQLSTVCGTYNVKLVFLCQSSIYFIDFSETTPQIIKMNGLTNVYFPVISQDGQKIAYQTGSDSEGILPDATNAAKIWLRELAVDGTPVKIADTAYVPRFVLNTPADTPAIVYATSVECPQKICYDAGKTLKRNIINNQPQLPETVCDDGSYYGGVSWDNRFLVTGWPTGSNAFMLDLQSGGFEPHGVHTMRVKKTVTDIDTSVTLGACNISRSASRIFTNTMLYFDFSSLPLNVANCYHPIIGSWAEHEILLISRYDAEDLRVYHTPADRILTPIDSAQGLGEAVDRQWSNPEWSNHPYFATAGLYIDRLWNVNSNWEHTYKNESIYLINLKDSTFLKLCESNDTSYASNISMTYPYLWVEVPASFAEDTTWLSKTIWERAGVGIIHERHNNRQFKTVFPLFSKSGFVVYNVQGRMVYQLKQIKFTQKTMRELRHTIKSGVYIVKGKGSDTKRFAYRFILQ